MKLHSLPVDILAKALVRVKKDEPYLEHMLTTLKAPRKEMSQYAPRVESIQINPDKIREVIGKGGETIQKITC